MQSIRVSISWMGLTIHRYVNWPGSPASHEESRREHGRKIHSRAGESLRKLRGG
jgi:hypothetical protein